MSPIARRTTVTVIPTLAVIVGRQYIRSVASADRGRRLQLMRIGDYARDARSPQTAFRPAPENTF